MKKTGWLFVTCMLILSVVLAGCNNGKQSSGNESESGGTLIYGRGADSTALDPAITTDGESFMSHIKFMKHL